jgi:hypothetical protein
LVHHSDRGSQYLSIKYTERLAQAEIDLSVGTVGDEQNLAPTLRGLAHPVLNGQEPLLATGCDANNHKGAELVIFASKAAVDAVGPDVDQRFIVQRGLSPVTVFVGPIALET